jgi:hypothetical protein
MMWRRLLVIDLILLAVLVNGALRVRQSWIEFESTHRVETVRPEAEPAQTIPGSAIATSTPGDWTDISVKDPFSFDRNDIAIVAPKAALVPNQPKPVLFGTMSVGNQWIAMLAPGQSGSRSSRPIKVGESFDDWKILEINDKSVVVAAANGNRETITLNGGQVPRSSEKTGTGSASPAPVVVTQSQTATAPAASSPATSPQPAAQPAPATQSPAQDEILNTPFGPVKKTKP